MPDLSIFDLIALRNEELVARGLDPRRATSTRERYTGHIQRLSPQWVRSIGMWGGLNTIIEIATECEVEVETARSYASRMKLKYQTNKRLSMVEQLAVASFATLPRPAAEVGPQLGLLPVEVVLYRRQIDFLLGDSGVDFRDLLEWPIGELQRAWQRLGLSIFPPRSMLSPPDAFDPKNLDHIRRALRHADPEEDVETDTPRRARSEREQMGLFD